LSLSNPKGKSESAPVILRKDPALDAGDADAGSQKLLRPVPGAILSAGIAGLAWAIGGVIPVLGAPLSAILIGMALSLVIADKPILKPGIDFTSKKLLQTAIVLLGFGLNLALILEIGRESLLAIVGAITAGLLMAFLMQKALKLPGRISTLIGVGSAICGGSAIAATAPVISADDDEVASAISIVVFFNVIALFIFPIIGQMLNMTADQFGIFAGAAINDTSSVTAAAAIWDNANQLVTTTLETAVTVKLIRTLAIIPITLSLAYYTAKTNANTSNKFNAKKAFPQFILWFIVASLVATFIPVPPAITNMLRIASRFLIVMAMAAIGLKTNPVKLVKNSAKPLAMGLTCSLAIIAITLAMLTI